MRRTIICAMLLFAVNDSYSQKRINDPLVLRDAYLKKSKNQKTAALILLGGGFTSLVTSIAVAVSSIDLDNNNRNTNQRTNKITRVLTIGGTVAILGSLPLFICSGRNRKKAMMVSGNINLDKVPYMQQAGMISQTYPSISIKISF